MLNAFASLKYSKKCWHNVHKSLIATDKVVREFGARLGLTF